MRTGGICKEPAVFRLTAHAMAKFFHAQFFEEGRRSIRSASGRGRFLIRLLRGYINQQIADRVKLSVKTIESCRARLMQTLGLKNRAALMKLAVVSGVLNKPDQV